MDGAISIQMQHKSITVKPVDESATQAWLEGCKRLLDSAKTPMHEATALTEEPKPVLQVVRGDTPATKGILMYVENKTAKHVFDVRFFYNGKLASKPTFTVAPGQRDGPVTTYGTVSWRAASTDGAHGSVIAGTVTRDPARAPSCATA